MALTLSPKALSRWAWCAGMAAIDRSGKRWRICAGENGHLYAVGEPSGYTGGWLSIAPLIGAVPDLTDEVTALSLPAVARKAWACPGACGWSREVLPRGAEDVEIHWVVEIRAGVQFFAPTEPKAWIAALEAAP